MNQGLTTEKKIYKHTLDDPQMSFAPCLKLYYEISRLDFPFLPLSSAVEIQVHIFKVDESKLKSGSMSYMGWWRS